MHCQTERLGQLRYRTQSLFRKLKTRPGATLFEYALILFLVSIIAIVILQGIGGKTNNMVTTVNTTWQ
ncbi:MAG TPA: Flp family type IVb pilin [Verrucomicrobiae bacterium]|nr:Flp family type IVb pilin [Verrucomicrobiae bacterium]